MGLENHRLFISFLAFADVLIVLFLTAAYIHFSNFTVGATDAHAAQQGLSACIAAHPVLCAWLLHYLLYVLLLSSLLHQHSTLVAQNLTINEAMNWFKYPWFKNQHGQFNNPFSMGSATANCLSFWTKSQDPAAVIERKQRMQQEVETGNNSGGQISVRIDRQGQDGSSLTKQF